MNLIGCGYRKECSNLAKKPGFWLPVMDYPRALDSSPEDRGLGVRDWEVVHNREFFHTLFLEFAPVPFNQLQSKNRRLFYG